MGCSVTRSLVFIPLSIRTRYFHSFIFGIIYRTSDHCAEMGFFVSVFFDGFDLVDHRQGVRLQSMGVPRLSCQRVSQQQRRRRRWNNNTDFPHLHRPFARVLIDGRCVRVCVLYSIICTYYVYRTTTGWANAGCQYYYMFARTIAGPPNPMGPIHTNSYYSRTIP